jgi:hypothetical protein
MVTRCNGIHRWRKSPPWPFAPPEPVPGGQSREHRCRSQPIRHGWLESSGMSSPVGCAADHAASTSRVSATSSTTICRMTLRTMCTASAVPRAWAPRVRRSRLPVRTSSTACRRLRSSSVPLSRMPLPMTTCSYRSSPAHIHDRRSMSMGDLPPHRSRAPTSDRGPVGGVVVVAQRLHR